MKLVLMLISLSSFSVFASGTINVKPQDFNKKMGVSKKTFLCMADESLKDCQSRFKAKKSQIK